jgi:hypothetical protein
VWLMGGCGLRIEEALAVEKADFIEDGTVPRVMWQAAPDGRPKTALKRRKGQSIRRRMKEDASRLRSGTSPQVAATLRNTVIAALRFAGFTSVAAGRRWAARNPARPLTALNLIKRE